MSTIDQAQDATKETLQLKSGQLVTQVKRIFHEGNVSRIVVVAATRLGEPTGM